MSVRNEHHPQAVEVVELGTVNLSGRDGQARIREQRAGSAMDREALRFAQTQWMTKNLVKGLASTAMAHSPLATRALADYYFWDSGMTDSPDPHSTLQPDT